MRTCDGMKYLLHSHGCVQVGFGVTSCLQLIICQLSLGMRQVVHAWFVGISSVVDLRWEHYS